MGIHRLRRRWLIENIPTSRVRSAAMGMVELKGKSRAVPEGPAIPGVAAAALPGVVPGSPVPLPFRLKSPVRGIACVWSRVRVTKEVRHNKGTSHQVILDRVQGTPFFLEDDTGRILVLPAGAEVQGVQLCDVTFGGVLEPPPDVKTFCDMNGIAWRGIFAGRHQVEEWALLLDADTYVLGELGRLGDASARRKAGILKRLREMLASPEVKARLDTNKDGTLDQLEWEAARREAEDAEIRRDLMTPDGTPRTAVSKPAHGCFIIASGSETDALKAFGYPWFFIVGGLAALVFGVWVFPAGVAKAPLVLVPAGVSVAAALFGFKRAWKR